MNEHYTLNKNTEIDPAQLNFKQCISLGNSIVFLALITMTTCILISFAFEQHFSLPAQITAHIVTILSAALAKIGYVIRCVGAHALGHKAY